MTGSSGTTASSTPKGSRTQGPPPFPTNGGGNPPRGPPPVPEQRAGQPPPLPVGPARRGPQPPVVVAAVGDERGVGRVGDRRDIQAEGGHVDLVGGPLVVQRPRLAP